MGDKFNWGQELGMMAASEVGAGIWGMAMQGVNDKRQLKQQGKLNALNVAASKEMGKFNQEMAMKMWNETNYEAQLEHMKRAGLNPALMYGMGGGGGTTANTAAGNAGGGQAPVGGGEMGMALQQGMQLALLKAQKENIEADTKLKEADTTKTSGVDTALGNMQIKNLTQGIVNQEVQAELGRVQTNIARVDLWIKDKSKEDAAEIIQWQADKILEEMISIQQQNKVDRATMDDRINIVKTELAGMYLKNALTKSQKELTDAQTTTEKGKPALQQQEIAESNARIENYIRTGQQKWRELEISGQNANTAEARQKWEAAMRDVSDSQRIPMDVLKGLFNIITKK